MKDLTKIAKVRYLRKEQTLAEKILWRKLRNNKQGFKWRRQHPIDMYIVDFYCPKVKLAVELDGSVHNSQENREYDSNRTNYLQSKYIHLIRFWNSDVEKNTKRVLEKIQNHIKKLLDQTLI